MPNEFELRPPEIVEMYWRENLVIPEDAELLDLIYLGDL